jgi:5-methylcytosine-specific restriction endonuclease McrA
MNINIRKSGVPPFIQTKYDIQKARPIEDYLSNKIPMQSDKLKIRIIKEGILDPICAICGLTYWMQQDIPLELDHKNGDHNDNRKENLQLICPNCHAQTDTYRVKKEGAKSAIDVHGGAPKND